MTGIFLFIIDSIFSPGKCEKKDERYLYLSHAVAWFGFKKGAVY